ncbi:hypothetical protein MBLNU230_g5281t1 [Neophaeotheca triangularis]
MAPDRPPTNPQTLHASLLRPPLLQLLRSIGFTSTKPSVLDTLTDLTQRYLLLLAETTAKNALAAQNLDTPSLGDVRMALQECGALTGFDEGGAALEGWREAMRAPLGALGEGDEGVFGGEEAREARVSGVKRKREERDIGEVREWKRWFEGNANREFRRVAGTLPESGAAVAGGGVGAVGVGGGRVQGEDFLQGLKKKSFGPGKSGGTGIGMGLVEAEGRLVGTVLGQRSKSGDDQEKENEKVVKVEGGPVGRLSEWKPRVQEVGPGWGRRDDVGENRGHSRTGSESSGMLSEAGSATLEDIENEQQSEGARACGKDTAATPEKRSTSAAESPERAESES